MSDKEIKRNLNLLGIDNKNSLDKHDLNYWHQKKYLEIKESSESIKEINEKLIDINYAKEYLDQFPIENLIRCFSKKQSTKSNFVLDKNSGYKKNNNESLPKIKKGFHLSSLYLKEKIKKYLIKSSSLDLFLISLFSVICIIGIIGTFSNTQNKVASRKLTPKQFWRNKLNQAIKNGRTEFFNINDGPFRSYIYLNYDSFENKYSCNLSNSGFDLNLVSENFSLPRGRAGFLESWRDNRFKDRLLIEYKLDNGSINKYYPEIYTKDRYVKKDSLFKTSFMYSNIPFSLFGNSKKVDLRYRMSQYTDQGRRFPIYDETFSMESINLLKRYYKLCKDPNSF